MFGLCTGHLQEPSSLSPRVSQGTTQVPCTVTFTPFALLWQHSPSEPPRRAFPLSFYQMQFYHYSGRDFLSECNIKGKNHHSSQCYFSIPVKGNRPQLFPSPLIVSFHTVVLPISQFNYFLLGGEVQSDPDQRIKYMNHKSAF